MKINEISPLSLAFIGDAVHTLFVREYFLKNSNSTTPKIQHSQATSYCRAKAQSAALDKIYPLLTTDEQDLIRRTRNQKNHNAPKNSNIEEYKKATCFEAIVGYWHLTDKDRLNYFLLKTMEE